MAMPDYTVVIGLDDHHIKEFALAVRTWHRHKPGLFDVPWVVFLSGHHLLSALSAAIGHIQFPHLTICRWPWESVVYKGTAGDKWNDPHRVKMLSGFVYVPRRFVKTPYWLKIDTDAVAHGHPDWIDEHWFDDEPAIVAPPWGYTKPADQMMKLDDWFSEARAANCIVSPNIYGPPLKLQPTYGSSLVRHKRIISWCGFFNTEFTNKVAMTAELSCGFGKIPVGSQDGFMFYMAKRANLGIVTPQLKRLGWSHVSRWSKLESACAEALA